MSAKIDPAEIPLTQAELARRIDALPPHDRRIALQAASAIYMKGASAPWRTPAAVELENRGWEPWLTTLAPHIFYSQFEEFDRKYWDWLWAMLLAKRAGKRLVDLKVELAYLYTLSRGLGKSSGLEWSFIAMGALLGRVLGLYISSTSTLAEGHLNNIREELESPLIEEYYPGLANPEVGKFDNRYGWTAALLASRSGLTIFAAGLQGEVRGLKRRHMRPMLIGCHEKGTRIFADGRWMPVEDHPTAQPRFSNGYKVRVWGVPESEVVTPDHRYWVREYVPRPKQPLCYLEGATGWKEPADLHDHCWVGLPIDTTVEEPRTIPKFQSQRSFQDPSTGRLTGRKGAITFADYLPPEFSDPDWWWFFGYWWGDGWRTKTQVCVVIANKDLHVKWRIEALLNKYQKPYTIRPKVGCIELTLSSTHLARWLQTWRKPGNARKQPPEWVERLPLKHQRQLVRGYIDADGYVREFKEGRKGQEIRITSVNAEGLLCLRRILARLSVPASVTKGTSPRFENFPGGYRSWSQQKYELRIQENAAQFGYNIHKSNRYKFHHAFIADGYLWTKVRAIEPVEFAEFVPISTRTRTYQTHFGLSHNCDEFDSKKDTPDIVATKESIIGGSIFGTQTADTLIVMAQNIIHARSVADRTQKRQNELLSYRKESGLIRAFSDDLEIEMVGTRWFATKGHPLYARLDMAAFQKFLDTSGPIETYAEYQHRFDLDLEGKVFKNYNDLISVITEEDFERMYGVKRPPPTWNKYVFNDKARTNSEFHVNAAGTLTMSSQNSRLPGITFLYDMLSFPAATEPEDCAVAILKCITPTITVMGVTYTWEDLVKSLISRNQIARFTKTRRDEIKAQREGLAQVIPEHVHPLLVAFNYQKFRMSHEADDWRAVYRDAFGLPFFPSNPGMHGGTAMINLVAKVDPDVPDPFGRRVYDEQGNDIGPLMGMSRWYMIVKKEKLPYPTVTKPELLHGSDRARYQFTEQRYLDPKVTSSGETEGEPEKRNDDFFNGMQMFYVDHSIQARELTPGEMQDATLPTPLQAAVIEAEVDPEKKASNVMAREIALRKQANAEITKQLSGGGSRGKNRLSSYKKLARRGV